MRDKRRKRLERRAAKGDAEGLEKLALRAPAAAARALAARLAQDASDAGLVDLAARLTARLRADGQHLLAADLAAATGGATTALRLDEALAAFALGDDARAAAAIRGDARVAASLAPLLSAARLGTARHVRSAFAMLGAGARQLPAARALEAAAAWGAARAGSKAARAAFARVIGERVALEHPLVQDALFDEALAAGAHEPLDRALAARGMDAARRDLSARALASAKLEEPSAAAAAIARAGAAAFDAAVRGDALVFEGFGLLGAEPAQAARVLGSAIAAGGDRVEALRGAWLASMASGRDGRAVQDAAWKLCDALADDADGVAAAVAVAEMTLARLTRSRAADPDLRKWTKRLRDLAARLGPAGAAPLVEAEVCAAELELAADPARALALVAPVLERAPSHGRAWRVRLAAALRCEPDRYDAWLEQAARASGDREIAIMARRARLASGAIQPLADVRAWELSAPVLAADLAWGAGAALVQGDAARWCDDCEAFHVESGAIPALGPALAQLATAAAPHRAGLERDERAAFDAALLGLASAAAADHACPDALARVLADLAHEWRDEPARLEQLALVAIDADEDAFLAAARALVAHGADPRALDALARAARACDADLGEQTLKIVVPGLDAASVRALRAPRRLEEDTEDPAARALAAFDALIEPGLSLRDLSFEGIRDPERARRRRRQRRRGRGRRRRRRRDADAKLIDMVNGVRLRPEFAHLTRAQIENIVFEAIQIAATKDGMADIDDIDRLLQKYERTPATVPSRSARNKRKRERRGRR